MELLNFIIFTAGFYQSFYTIFLSFLSFTGHMLITAFFVEMYILYKNSLYYYIFI